MIRVPDRCVYLCAPSTGSRSTEVALIAHCGGERISAGHHAHDYEMHMLDQFSEPTICVMRDPFDFVASRYQREHDTRQQRERVPIEAWIPQYAKRLPTEPISREFGRSRMTAYVPFCDRVFLYEDGLHVLFEFIGFPDAELPRIGAWENEVDRGFAPRLRGDDLSAEARALIEHHFADEIGTYHRVKARRG